MGGGVQRYRNAKVDIFLGAGAQRVRAFARAEKARLAYARQLLVNPREFVFCFCHIITRTTIFREGDTPHLLLLSPRRDAKVLFFELHICIRTDFRGFDFNTVGSVYSVSRSTLLAVKVL